MAKLAEVKCCNCGKDMTITKSTYNRHIKKYGHDIDHYCKECSHIGNSKHAKNNGMTCLMKRNLKNCKN